MTRKAHILLVDGNPAENVILSALIRKVDSIDIELHYCRTMDSAIAFLLSGKPVSMILLDNLVHPRGDFRETVPTLRHQGFIGPIGVISSSPGDAYFQSLEEYGADFRIDKSEIDATAIEFILREYLPEE